MPQISEVLDVAGMVFSRGRGRGFKGGTKGKGPDAAIDNLSEGVNKALDKVAKKLLGRDAVPPPSPYPQPGLPPNLNPARKPFPAPSPKPQPQPAPGRNSAPPKVSTKTKDDSLVSGKGVVRMSDALRIVALYSVPAMRAAAQKAMLAQQLGQFNKREKVALAPLYPGEPTRYVQYRVSGEAIDRTDDDLVAFISAQPPGNALT